MKGGAGSRFKSNESIATVNHLRVCKHDVAGFGHHAHDGIRFFVHCKYEYFDIGFVACNLANLHRRSPPAKQSADKDCELCGGEELRYGAYCAALGRREQVQLGRPVGIWNERKLRKIDLGYLGWRQVHSQPSTTIAALLEELSRILSHPPLAMVSRRKLLSKRDNHYPDEEATPGKTRP
jgi:hypothetical protein